ncbi:substrate-binding domain-containing protein [Microlunatus antarcticus]|uniref:Fructose transport system substrate-binding protein n=1 Tax=Microlunatus antarcticus TaxID=53388 RepID=A0A7W5JZB8_9ACTN|nr:substrate-binding domain-containing protein [Microlunatus antarcticus]MBB3328945.1 fructose transport system substrate-binding protein [Microlunatus antarcticus]
MQRRSFPRRLGLVPATLIAATTLVLAGCSGSATPGATGSGSSAAGGDKEVAVTLITKDSINPFWIAMQNGAKQASEANNVKLTIAAGKEDGDEAGQVEAIEAAVVRGDQGILITPNGPGINTAITNARQAGLFVIALDTPPEPANTVDITFATDNFAAGEAIGKWTAAQLDGKKATIALLDAFNDKVISVDYNRDQGFLTGMGIDTKDKTKNGDEDKTGKYTGGKGGDYEIVCNEPTKGAQDGGKSAMEACLSKSGDIDTVYTLNEPGAAGAADALKAAGKSALIVSVDGGCQGVENVQNGTIGATSQQYPLKMAQLGVEAIAKIARGGEKPAVTPGLDFYDTGVQLVTDKKVDGLDSIDTTEGLKLCWGEK